MSTYYVNPAVLESMQITPPKPPFIESVARGTGRTTAIILAGVLKALQNPHTDVNIRDHSTGEPLRALANHVRAVCDKLHLSGIEVRECNDRFASAPSGYLILRSTYLKPAALTLAPL